MFCSTNAVHGSIKNMPNFVKPRREVLMELSKSVIIIGAQYVNI